MSHWSKGVPHIWVPRSVNPKPVTFVYPYYMNHDFAVKQIVGWCAYPASLRQHLSAIVVDDGSPTPMPPIGEVAPFPIRQFRIDQDIPWNWLAARNIGMHHASDGWCLMTDMDHVVPPQTAESLVYGKHDPSIAYAFSRIEHTGDIVRPHSASWFLTKELFWNVGGYDESYSGSYGSDGRYRRRLMAACQTRVLTDRLVRYENVGDSSTTEYRRKLPQDDQRLKAIDASLKPGHRPKTLSFPYHEVTAHVA